MSSLSFESQAFGVKGVVAKPNSPDIRFFSRTGEYVIFDDHLRKQPLVNRTSKNEALLRNNAEAMLSKIFTDKTVRFRQWGTMDAFYQSSKDADTVLAARGFTYRMVLGNSLVEDDVALAEIMFSNNNQICLLRLRAPEITVGDPLVSIENEDIEDRIVQTTEEMQNLTTSLRVNRADIRSAELCYRRTLFGLPDKPSILLPHAAVLMNCIDLNGNAEDRTMYVPVALPERKNH